jgi:uncharacterized membrane protein
MATRPTTRKSTGRATTAARPTPSSDADAWWQAFLRRADDGLGWAMARVGRGWRALAGWAGGGLSFTMLIASVLGLGDAAYLTYQHFSSATTFAGCSGTGSVNCEAVTTSAWSYLFGSHLLPVSVLGLAFFAFMTAVNSPWGWRAPWPAVHWARLIAVIAGIALVLYLIWAELFRIKAICLYCTGVHVLTFILFALIVGRATFSGLRPVSDDG